MENVKTEREMEDVRQQVNTSLTQMLSTSTQYYPPFMACVMVSLLFGVVFVSLFFFGHRREGGEEGEGRQQCQYPTVQGNKKSIVFIN